MATAKRQPWEDGVKVAGAIVDDVGLVLPYVAVAYAVSKIIIEYAQAAKANKDSCMLLAKRATGIRNMLVEYFGPDGEKLMNKRHGLMNRSLLACLSDLESGLQSACSLVKKFSSAESAYGKVVRAMRAKNYLGEFQACGDRLTELESQLSSIITSKIAHDQEQNQQELLRKLEQNHQEMMRARDADRVRDRSMLERELRALPERIAVLQMHSMSTSTPNPYRHASHSKGGDSMQSQLIEPWFIDVADVEKEERVHGKKRKFVTLGTGGFGTVFRGTCGGETVAIKQVNSSGDKAIQEFKNELEMMWRVSHENIIRTHGGFYPLAGVDDHEGEVPLILLEYAPKGSLEKYMFASNIMTLLPKDTLLIIFREVLEGLKYLHASKIVHRDIKPQNILLMDDWTPKISDFGLATVKNSRAFAKSTVGTSQYMAPEVIRGDQYDRSCDVWSYGVMLFEMILGEAMFESDCTMVQILRIIEDPLRGVPWDRLKRSEYARQWPSWVVNMAHACLQPEPRRRATVSDVWLEFYDRMGAEGATAAARSQTSQYVPPSFDASMTKLDAFAARFSQVTVESGRSEAASSGVGGSPARPSGSRPLQVQVLSVDERLRLAEEWEQSGNMPNAYECIKQAAEAGTAEGRFRLGKILLDGTHGMSQHLEHGAGWVRAAAEKDYVDAMIEFGRCHHSGWGVPQNMSLAKEWYGKAAKLGSSAGSAWLEALEAEERQARRDAAGWQRRGQIEELTNSNYTEALLWYRKAAQVGDAYSQCRVGYFYQKGWGGLREDQHAAAEWFRKAAEQGDADAQCNLGLQHENGLGGLREDKCAAVEWYRKAAEQGNARAQCMLGVCYASGEGVVREDKRTAVAWFRKAAEQGIASAQNNLALCYASGEGGLPEDKRAAVEWFHKAAIQGVASAQYNLGYYYDNGEGGLSQDKRAAVEWYRHAAEQGNARAQYNLGACYENGEGGLRKDKRAAAEWYRKAAEKGIAQAKSRLNQMR
ncbi:Secretory immunoglobulin A-binding protein EsiB [Porphyridium purpureum]|uniref:Secretory immunoglobulin A-binding protein EsiB n=1 Tax=Porphyridium purpureum TaxID=35688 RepID=A0A5J4YIH0_PORPP|nr:Secretory immunoglobulin A-binding protein EsiB [Porphyridium purpureum]|eukprot:POR5625..scf255_21